MGRTYPWCRNQIEWFLWKVDDKNMLKKILIGMIVVIIVGFGGYDIYTRIQKSHEPELVFVDKDLRTVAEDNFNPYYYVIKAEDYRGKDINDKKHLAYKVKSKGKKSVKVIYILTDDKGHFVQKELTLKKVKTVNYTPEGEQNGALSNAPKKENKVFLFSDYDQIAIRAMAEADNYGHESSQNYTVNPTLDENGELIGYECVFLN